MCSVPDGDYGDSVECMKRQSLDIISGSLCRKCGECAPEVVLRKKDVYCRHCFLSSVTHKFRATLGKSRMLKRHENILIGLSGSESSCALVHLVREGLDETSHKRLQCSPFVVYIDEGAVVGHSKEERQNMYHEIVKFMEKYDMPIFISSIDKSMDNDGHLYYPVEDGTSLHIDENNDTAINLLFDTVENMSAKEDLLVKIRLRLLTKIAKKLNCSNVFVGDTETDLAVTLMSNVCLGRGAQIPLDVGFCDFRNSDVNILRPLRNLTKKEIAFCNHFHEVQSVSHSSLLTKGDSNSSIQKLTETFILGLQNEFPATVSTIFRTGDKLTVNSNSSFCDDTCILCQAPFDTAEQSSSAMQATDFSSLVSLTGPNKSQESEAVYNCKVETVTTKSNNCCSDNCGCNATTKNSHHTLEFSEIKEHLCYGCRLIFKEMRSLDALPAEITKSIRDRSIRKQMKKEIEDYLL